MVRLGIPELVVSRVLNHAVQGVTGKVYALHSYAPEKRHALDTWAAEIDRAVNGDRGGNVVKLERGA
jgi:phosphoserine phosphatase